MENQFVPYEIALEIKELGFEEPCIAVYVENPIPTIKEKWLKAHFVNSFKEYYNSKLKKENVAVPLWQQAFDWFREKYNLTSWVYQSNNESFHYSILQNGRFMTAGYKSTVTYEEARQACLEKLIELCKKK